jgi:HSP20 family protein
MLRAVSIGGLDMAEAATKLRVKTVMKGPEGMPAAQAWAPFESLHNEIDRLFDDFGSSFWRSPLRRSLFAAEPFWQRAMSWKETPAVDISETDKAYEITAELPGMDEKNIEVTVANGNLIIKGEKQEEKEERKRDYYLQERHFGSFERRFAVPDSVDINKIDATFKKGVLVVTLPKTAEAQKPEKKIAVKAAA